MLIISLETRSFRRGPTRSSPRISRERSSSGARARSGFSALPAAEAIERSLDIIIPTRLQKRHWDGYRRVIESGESRYGQGDVLAVPGIAKDGRQLSLEFTIVLLRDGPRGLIGLAAIMRDVTERFEQTRALKRKLAGMIK